MSDRHKSLNISDMDSTAADAAQGTRTYYLFHDAKGTAHMVDRANEVPAGAKQVQKITVPAKEAPPPSTLSRVEAATVGRAAGWLPPGARDALSHNPLSWNAAGAVILALFFFIRFSTFRSLVFKVAVPIVLLALGVGGFMTYRHRHSGTTLAQSLTAAQHSAATMQNGLRQQERVMQQVEADASAPSR